MKWIIILAYGYIQNTKKPFEKSLSSPHMFHLKHILKLLSLLYLLSISTIASAQLEIVPRMPEEIVAGDTVNKLLPRPFHLVPNTSFGVPIKLLIVSESNSTGLPSPQVIAQELNKIYSLSVLEWQVEQQSIAGLYGGISEINDCKSGILSSYSGQMKEVIAAYEKTKGKATEGTVVLFVMQGNTCGMEAYMPLQQQYGFLFTQQIGTQPEKQHYVIAHELGHALGLYHTFSSFNEYYQSKGSTNNIMDYPSTTPSTTLRDRPSTGSTSTLNKYQWDAIHDPKMRMAWFEGDEEGMISIPCIGIFDECKDVIKKIEALKKAHQDGELISGKIPSTFSEKILDANYVKLGDTDYKKLSFIFYGTPEKDYTIDPKKYKTYSYLVQDAFESKNKIFAKGIRYEIEGKDVIRILVTDNEEVILEKVDALIKYIFEKKDESQEETTIDIALIDMEKFIGNSYAYGGGDSRTSVDEKGTDEMDCSEFAARFLQKACSLEEVPSPFYTSHMLTSMEDGSFDSFLQHVKNSEKEDFKDIRPGDIFLWSRSSSDGHTGVVVSYDKETDKVVVIEAIGSSGASEESLSKDLDGYCIGCIRKSIYTRTGKALYKHAGWKGYFRAVTTK